MLVVEEDNTLTSSYNSRNTAIPIPARGEVLLGYNRYLAGAYNYYRNFTTSGNEFIVEKNRQAVSR